MSRASFHPRTRPLSWSSSRSNRAPGRALLFWNFPAVVQSGYQDRSSRSCRRRHDHVHGVRASLPGEKKFGRHLRHASMQDAVLNVYQPKICLSVIGSAFEVQRGGRQTCAIFVGEDVKTQAGPDLKALIASHKQQAAYIDALHEELRRLCTPSYRPVSQGAPPVARQVLSRPAS
mmetsp:Transcript_12472/g.31094  ORF Transcript_12472/g.31094 Transcript_12472/m.31094 type:complete len:175 (+) Transcript_12472:253-777(+)